MTPRLIVVDVDTGIAVGFVMFAGTYDDFHMFHIEAGQVNALNAVLFGPAVTSPGWPG